MLTAAAAELVAIAASFAALVHEYGVPNRQLVRHPLATVHGSRG